MSNQLSYWSPDEQRFAASAAGDDPLDYDALAAFVRAAEAGDVADCEPATITATARAVASLLAAEPDHNSGPSARKWADAAGYTADSTEAPTDTEYSQPVAHEELPDSVNRAAASDAYEAVLAYLVAAGPATRREIVAHVMPSHPLGYTPPPDGDADGGEWWSAVIEPTLQVDLTVTHDERAGYLLGDWLR